MGAPVQVCWRPCWVAKHGLHVPLTCRIATYAREGIELDISRLADWVAAPASSLMPLVEATRAHVFAAEIAIPSSKVTIQ